MPSSLPTPRHRGLSPRQRALAALCARAVLPLESPLAPALARARAKGVATRALEELGLMLHLYAGFPAAIEFLRALRTGAHAAAPRPARQGARAPNADPRAWRARGEALCARVYGKNYPALRRFTRWLHPDLDAWMIVDGYGKTLSRPGLSALERELMTVAALSALGWAPQLAAHRAGAMRLGAGARAVSEADALGARVRMRAGTGVAAARTARRRA